MPRSRSISSFLALAALSLSVPLKSGAEPVREPFEAYLGVFPSLSPEDPRDWRFVDAFPNLRFEQPMGVVPYPGTSQLVVPGRKGRIYLVENDPATETADLFLDISERVVGNHENGVQSLVFHPEFGREGSSNARYIFIIYNTYLTEAPPPGSGYTNNWRLSRFTVNESGQTVDSASELILIEQPKQNIHNGGAMFFHPDDGFLYFSVGDGNLDENRQQIDKRLFGGVFRIDVDMDGTRSHPIGKQPLEGFTANYYIPDDNPFVGVDGALGEFWALGLRNPFRMTLDPVTQRITLGDVGGSRWEEINVVAKGANFQWPFTEGAYRHRPTAENPIGELTEPIHMYSHSVGFAVVGGYSYRGDKYADELGGGYIFGDYLTGVVYKLREDDDAEDGYRAEVMCELPPLPPSFDGTRLNSFGVDHDGELYATQLWDNGQIYRLVKNEDSGGEPFPATLAETGVFKDLETLEPADGLLPYEVNSPLWSDAAAKRRWMGIPSNGAPYLVSERIFYADTGPWTFPQGTVFVKHFELPIDESDPGKTRRLETRFLVIDEQLGAYGATYRWREDGIRADLVPADGFAEEIEVSTVGGGIRRQLWEYPSRTQCMTCHTGSASYVLGVNTRQLNRAFAYPGEEAPTNQLAALSGMEMFDAELEQRRIEDAPALAAVDDLGESLEKRFRSYLDANCAHCHRPGDIRANFDARFDVPLVAQSLIGTKSFEDQEKTIVYPGDPGASYLLAKMSMSGVGQMPPLARNVVHEDAVEVVRDYILSLRGNALLPEGWRHTRVGESHTPGTALYGDGVFSVSGAAFIAPLGYDNFDFASQRIQGDFVLTAKVNPTNAEGLHGFARSGLMIRRSVQPDTPYMGVMLSHYNLQVWTRTHTGAHVERNVSISRTGPTYLQMERQGDTLVARMSPDGARWQELHRQRVVTGGESEAGLFVAGHDEEKLNYATFEKVSVRLPSFDIDVLDPFASDSDLNSARFRVSRSGNLSESASLPLAVGGTATAGDDYEALPSQVAFASGVSEMILEILPVSDRMVEGAETVELFFAGQTARVWIGDSIHTVWAEAHFTESELADEAVSGDSADPDGDGLTNLAEYAFQSDPKNGAAPPLPELEMTEDGVPVLVFRESKDAPGLRFAVQVSSDLRTWTPAVDPQEERIDHGHYWEVRVREARNGKPAERRFMRLVISRE